MRISDRSSDVCSSDLTAHPVFLERCKPGSGHLNYCHQSVDPFKSVTPLCTRFHARFHAHIFRMDAESMRLKATLDLERSEESRVGKECVSTCRSRWSPLY